MRLMVISGFLGSGKTTFLIGLIKRLLSEDGALDFVILENEAGEIGIDGACLEKEGLRVRELFSGCVCCQLAGELVVSLRDIKSTLNPDCVFLETSGLARVRSILDTLDKYCAELESVHVVSLADVERCDLYLKEPMPFVKNQLENADLVVINKTDSAESDTVKALAYKLREMNQRAEIVGISALEGTGLDPVAERVLAWMHTTS